MRLAIIDQSAITAFTAGHIVDGSKVSSRWNDTTPVIQVIAAVDVSPWLRNINRLITVPSERMPEQMVEKA